MLAKRYNLRSWDVRFALEIPRLTTTETGPLTHPITGELADLIESMISRRLNGRQIWTELLDHHDYLVTYDSIRHYLRYTRPRTASPQAASLTSNLVVPGQQAAHPTVPSPMGASPVDGQLVADRSVSGSASWVAAQVASRHSPSSEGEPGSVV